MSEIAQERWVGKFKINSSEAIGELTYHPVDGISLDARIWPSPKDYADYFQAYPVISGFTNGDRPCTIVDAGDHQLTTTSGEHRRSITANTILLNVECKSADEPQFTEMTFRSPALTAFYEPSDIKAQRVRGSFDEFDASYRRPEPMKGSWGEHGIQINAAVHGSMRQSDDGMFQAIELVEYQISFATPVSVNVVLSHITAIEFILGIFTGQFAGCPVVHLRQQADSVNHGPIRLLRSLPWYGPYNYEAYRTTLVSIKKLGDHTLLLLSRWFSLYPRLQRIVDVYRASQLISDIETTFLFLIQAVEGIHRTCLPRKAIDQGEFDRGLAALRAAIPTDLQSLARQFFASRLEHFYNEPGLRSRLKELWRLVQDRIPMALEDAEKDIGHIVEVRNEFSHGTLSDAPDAYSLEAVSYYSHVVQTLFDFGLLALLEVPKEVLADMYYGNPRYSHHSETRTRLFPKKPVEAPPQ